MKNHFSGKILSILISLLIALSPPAFSLKKTEKKADGTHMDITLDKMEKGKQYDTDSTVRILLIRDLHCQEEAQLVIANALRQLYNKAGINTILLEGAEGPVESRLFKSFPDKNIRESVGKTFLSQGYLSGAEFADMVMGAEANLDIYGVENTPLYISNFNAFKKARTFKEKSQDSLNAVNTWLDSVKEKVYPENLISLDKVVSMLDGQQEMDFSMALGVLSDSTITGSSQLSPFKHYPQLVKLHKIVELEKHINRTKTDAELRSLLQLLERELVDEELKTLVMSSLHFRLGKMSPFDYLQTLKRFYSEYSSSTVSFEETFPGLTAWIEMTRLQEDIDFDMAFEQLEKLVIRLQDVLVQKYNVQDIISFDRTWKRIRRLLSLELNHNEYEQIRGKDIQAELDALFSTVKTIASKRNNISTISIDVTSLYETALHAMEFYTLAEKRNTVLTENTIQYLMEKAGRAASGLSITGILVTGGFHTTEIQKLLEQSGISYETWTPIIQGTVSMKAYERRMLKNSFEYAPVPDAGSRGIITMLSAPVLFNEVLGALGSENYTTKLKMLQALVDEGVITRSDWDGINTVLNDWFGDAGNEALLQIVSLEDLDMLFDALKEGVFLNLPELRKLFVTNQKGDVHERQFDETALEIIRSADLGKGLVKLAKIYFDKVIESRSKTKNNNFAMGTNIAGEEGPANITVNQAIAPDYEAAEKVNLYTFLSRNLDEEKLERFQNIKPLLESAQLVQLPGDTAYIARIFNEKLNEWIASYAHFGRGNVYIRKPLLDYLIEENNLEAFVTLLTIEMDRMSYREQHNGQDPRTPKQVIDNMLEKGTVTPDNIRFLRRTIAGAEYVITSQRYSNQGVEEIIVKAISRLFQIEGEIVETFGVELGELEGPYREISVQRLAQRVKKHAKVQEEERLAAEIALETSSSRRKALFITLQTALEQALDKGMVPGSIAIDPVIGDLYLNSINGETLTVSLKENEKKIVMNAAGKVNTIVIDLVRNVSADSYKILIENSIKALLDPLHQKRNSLYLENINTGVKHLNINGSRVLLISTGTPIEYNKETTINAVSYLHKAIDEGMAPVFLDSAILSNLTPSERRSFITRFYKVIALDPDDSDIVKDLPSMLHDQLSNNWRMFNNLPNQQKMAVVTDKGRLPAGVNAGELIIHDANIEGLGLITGLAVRIAQVGRDKAAENPELNNHLKQILLELYEENDTFRELFRDEELKDIPLKAILANPKKYIFPPVKTIEVQDVETYLRTQQILATMA